MPLGEQRTEVGQVPSAGKKAVIARVQDETGVKVVYSPGRAEDAIIWHPSKVLMKAKSPSRTWTRDARGC